MLTLSWPPGWSGVQEIVLGTLSGAFRLARQRHYHSTGLSRVPAHLPVSSCPDLCPGADRGQSHSRDPPNSLISHVRNAQPVPAFQRGALTGILFPRLARFTGFRDERQDGKGGKKRQSRPGKNPGQGRKKIGSIKARCADEHHKEDRTDNPRQGAAVAEKPVGPASSRRTRSAVCLMDLGPSGRSCDGVG